MQRISPRATEVTSVPAASGREAVVLSICSLIWSLLLDRKRQTITGSSITGLFVKGDMSAACVFQSFYILAYSVRQFLLLLIKLLMYYNYKLLL